MADHPMLTEDDVRTSEALQAFVGAMQQLGHGVGVDRPRKTEALRLALEGVTKLIGDNDMRDFSLVGPIQTWLNSNPRR